MSSTRSDGSSTYPVAYRSWTRLSKEQLLDRRICDLGLTISGPTLPPRIARVREELRRKGIVRFNPHFWLSSEWFTPDGVPGVAVPFYLAHPRLTRLEDELMLEVEGGGLTSCLKILRHEVGHAISNAYRLHLKKRWREVFGSVSEPYPEYYQPRPYSKRYVQHIDNWYAQSHPAEDFAETFAVWLTPGLAWRKRYKGWPALKKLEFVDELMGEIGDVAPPVRTRETAEPVRSLKMTLRQHYTEKRSRYGADFPDFYDRDLRRLFSDAPEFEEAESAGAFLRHVEPQIRRLVARWTGEYQYTIDQVLQDIIDRCDELNLHMDRPHRRATTEATILLTVLTMNYLHSGRHKLML